MSEWDDFRDMGSSTPTQPSADRGAVPPVCDHRFVQDSNLCYKCNRKIYFPVDRRAVHAAPERTGDFENWFRAHDLFWDEKRKTWGAYWSDRAGMEHSSLEFMAWHNDKYPTRWDAIMGHHASGTNPRMSIGTCDSVADVARIYEAVRLINGYQQPEGTPAALGAGETTQPPKWLDLPEPTPAEWEFARRWGLEYDLRSRVDGRDLKRLSLARESQGVAAPPAVPAPQLETETCPQCGTTCPAGWCGVCHQPTLQRHSGTINLPHVMGHGLPECEVAAVYRASDVDAILSSRAAVPAPQRDRTEPSGRALYFADKILNDSDERTLTRRLVAKRIDEALSQAAVPAPPDVQVLIGKWRKDAAQHDAARKHCIELGQIGYAAAHTEALCRFTQCANELEAALAASSGSRQA